MMSSIGKRIKQAREAKDLSQAKLGQFVGVSREAVSQWESDKDRPRDERLERVAEVLGRDYTWLRTGKGEAGGVRITLRTLRKRAHLTTEELARELSIPSREYLNYEASEELSGLPKHIVGTLKKVLVEHGVPSHDFATLAGIERDGGQAEGARALRSRVAQNLAETTMVPQLAVDASAGSGSADPAEISADAQVIAQWQVPDEVLRQFTPSLSDGLYFLTARGNSMEPLIRANAAVLVNRNDRIPSPPGIFVVWDGVSLVVKNIQVIAQSEPPRVKISSENPSFDPYERVEEEAYIQGRVIAVLQAT